MSSSPQAAALPPWATETPGKVRWLSTREFGELYQRSDEWARQACINGTAMDFGFRVYRDPFGRKWIAVPISQLPVQALG